MRKARGKGTGRRLYSVRDPRLLGRALYHAKLTLSF